MGKKLGDFTLRELFEECKTTSNCDRCRFSGVAFCDLYTPDSYFEERDFDQEIDTDEEVDVVSEKNDSKPNLEARIEKLEADVEKILDKVLRV